MSNWKDLLKDDPTEWLLEKDNPSVRYYTLRDILGKLDRDNDVKNAKKEIMKEGPVPIILAKQKPGGHWGKPEDFYERSKYRGTVWNLILLAELGADKKDKQIKDSCEFVLKWSQDRKTGGFAYLGSGKNGGYPSSVVPCLSGNMVWSLLRLGYLNESRVRKGIKWITTYQRFDDGVGEKSSDWPYERFKQCWGKHTCHMGVVKAMKALAEIPPNKRTKAAKRTIAEASEFMLIHHIYKRSRKLEKVSKPSWLKLGFPLMYQTDILEILGLLTQLGYRDERMKDAMNLVVSKQNDQGRWPLESTFNGRYLVNIERKDKPSKWVTLNALWVLKRFYS